MAQARWVGPHLYNLLTLQLSELCRLYPDYTMGGLKSRRAYWRKKIAEGEITMPSAPEQAPEVTEGQLVKTWEVSAFDREANEWVTRVNHSWDHTADALAQSFVPATPANITPSRRKPLVRDHRLLYVFSDAQIDYRRIDGELIPIHDERALRASRLLCADLQPDEIINCGDTVDLAVLSRFKLDSDHFHRTLGPSFQRVHDMYAELRADNPRARIVEVDSNHNTRLKDYMMKNAPSLYGLKRPGDPETEFPMFTYPYMANLAHVGVEWVSGYGAAEYIYGEENGPPIRFIHGQITASNASTAAKESKANPETHLVRGHSHSMEMHTRTTRTGQYLSSIVVGALCRTTGEVPSFHSGVDDHGRPVHYQENWQQGVLVIRDYGGTYQFDHVPIREGLIYYNGKLYNGDT